MSQHDPNDPNNPYGPWSQQQGWGGQPQAHWNPQQHQQGGTPAASSAFGGGFGGGTTAAAAEGGRPIAGAVATAGANERLAFVRKTYLHLAGAIFAFAGLCWVWLKPLSEVVAQNVLSFAIGGRYSWLIFLGLFIGVSWVADRWARSATSRPMQYLGLGLYVVAESIIFIPLLYIASTFGGPDVIPTAAIITLLIFGGLTATVFITRKDFSFLGGALGIASFGALGLIILSLTLGFTLGILFCWAMVILAAGYILYYTSRVLGHYHPQQYVAASLALFSAVALLFWYVIQIVMSNR